MSEFGFWKTAGFVRLQKLSIFISDVELWVKNPFSNTFYKARYEKLWILRMIDFSILSSILIGELSVWKAIDELTQES